MVSQFLVFEFAASFFLSDAGVHFLEFVELFLQVHQVFVLGVELLVQKVVLLVLVVLGSFFLEEVESERVVVSLEGVVDAFEVSDFGFESLDVEVGVVELAFETFDLVALGAVLASEVVDFVVVFVNFIAQVHSVFLALLQTVVLVLAESGQFLVVVDELIDFFDLT